jgi:hypothetical protein
MNAKMVVLVAALIAAPAGAQKSVADQASDARTAFARCLSLAGKSDLKEKVAPSAFKEKLATLCQAEREAFKAASLAADRQSGIRGPRADENAQLDIDDVVANAADHYQVGFEIENEAG